MARAKRTAPPRPAYEADPTRHSSPGRRVAQFRGRITAWYAAHRRDLPWRRRPNSYRVWVSEIMLQQTRVDVVAPYFLRFIARFPSVRALAQAPIEQVLEAWSGLGYYRRARMLHEGARTILERHGGRFPRTLEHALAVPGVGRYTAGAILSIAHGARAPIVDGNVARVLSRVFGIDADPEKSATRALLWDIAGRMVEEGEPGTVNQAMMELGALVCTPRSPECTICPAAAGCFARRHALVDRIPRPATRRASVDVLCTVLVVREGGRVLLRRRTEQELLPGLWDLPGAFQGVAGDRGASLTETLAALPLGVEVGERLGTVRHQVTHRRITLEVHEACASGSNLPAASAPARAALRWVRPEDAASMALAAPARKILARWGASPAAGASLDTPESIPLTSSP